MRPPSAPSSMRNEYGQQNKQNRVLCTLQRRALNLRTPICTITQPCFRIQVVQVARVLYELRFTFIGRFQVRRSPRGTGVTINDRFESACFRGTKHVLLLLFTSTELYYLSENCYSFQVYDTPAVERRQAKCDEYDAASARRRLQEKAERREHLIVTDGLGIDEKITIYLTLLHRHNVMSNDNVAKVPFSRLIINVADQAIHTPVQEIMSVKKLRPATLKKPVRTSTNIRTDAHARAPA
eukprot:6181807-Pleurochrysis_carterae.AAC.2